MRRCSSSRAVASSIDHGTFEWTSDFPVRDDPQRPGRGLGVGRVLRAELACPANLVGIDVGDRELLRDPGARLEDVDRAPVRELRHRQPPRPTRERGPEVERGREGGPGPGTRKSLRTCALFSSVASPGRPAPRRRGSPRRPEWIAAVSSMGVSISPCLERSSVLVGPARRPIPSHAALWPRDSPPASGSPREDREDLVEAARPGFCFAPARELLGDGVDERHVTREIGRDDRVPDAAQGRRDPCPRALFALQRRRGRAGAPGAHCLDSASASARARLARSVAPRRSPSRRDPPGLPRPPWACTRMPSPAHRSLECSRGAGRSRGVLLRCLSPRSS